LVLGVSGLFLSMFIRKKKNSTGTTSVHIIEKIHGKQRLVKSLGYGRSELEISNLEILAHQEISRILKQDELSLFEQQDQSHIKSIKESITHIRIVGTELVLDKIFDQIGFNLIKEGLFRDLVIARVVYPGSKLKTIEYLSRHFQRKYSISSVYRYLDTINDSYKDILQDISYKHTLKLFGGIISVVFYDVTTLYFEVSQEDELRKIGYSKDGKAMNPQIVLGLLVSEQGYPLAFEMYEGNKYEGHTILPVLDKFRARFKIEKLVVVADSGLMTKENVTKLIENKYDFILGARIKSESQEMKKEILSKNWENKKSQVFEKPQGMRLIVTHSEKRAKKDALNRERGIERLKSKIKSGKLTKQNINNRGYNKYLKIEGNASVELDLSKLNTDKKWDGLKGYLTNTTLDSQKVLDNYHQLWHIEKAFRMSKTDLKVRPIYHQKAKRIESHLIISFCSYKLYKELERQLKVNKIEISPERAINILKSIYSIRTTLPFSRKQTEIIMANTEEQKLILEAFDVEF